MQPISAQTPAAASGTFVIGGDLPVYRMGFGAMRVTGPNVWGDPPDRAAAHALLRRVVELGVTLLDTADSYGPGVSEQIIAEALHPYPSNLVIATKGGLMRSGPGDWSPNGHPEHLRRTLEGSLKRLRLERIDLYQLHAVDSRIPLDESVGALAEMRAAGKIRHVGLSNVDARQLARAQRIVPIVSVQNNYNLAERNSDSLVDVCAQQNIAFLPWCPIMIGARGRAGSAMDRVAQRHRATARQVALAWLLQRSATMIPIPGTSSIQHFEENVAASSLRLDEDDLAALKR